MNQAETLTVYLSKYRMSQPTRGKRSSRTAAASAEPIDDGEVEDEDLLEAGSEEDEGDAGGIDEVYDAGYDEYQGLQGTQHTDASD